MSPNSASPVGIIGSGNIGSAFARALTRAGLPGIISNSRDPESLTPLVAEIGGSIRAGTRDEAARQDIVLVAVPWSKLSEALAGLPDFKGRIVIDANNAIEPPLFQPAELHGQPSSAILSKLALGARVVKAFNHFPAALLALNPAAEGGRRVTFYSGDDGQAKAQVSGLIERLGFFGIDLGTLSAGGLLAQFPTGPLPIHNLVKFN